jgi:hypothetical protein
MKKRAQAIESPCSAHIQIRKNYGLLEITITHGESRRSTILPDGEEKMAVTTALARSLSRTGGFG